MSVLDRLKRRVKTGGNDRLSGRWRLYRAEGELDVGDGATMTFTNDGKLIYVIEENGKLQIMNLVYRVSGDTIVTNQASAPREEVSRFSFDEDDNLIIEFGGTSSWFKRE